MNEGFPCKSCNSAFTFLLRNGFVKDKWYKTNELDDRIKVEI